ncbi:Kinetochore-microtubule binding complex [Komagataella phaffii CBS 7435]|uniref:Protein required for accurate chromosome segregation n=2 Tax=Komagataella phaffii TaxID=460519 RepID=C4QW80_KOMPG|nr:Protein required for accurate chromosome segregation [Komagataella phaffii GS115]AOA60773.1 GQ67_02717T0 [Komagataella phaffii]CAH2446172.1 Kinetochore-microtubule binding complex [Komagataella phaffii CBS 7435]AOA65555.1 GQ68_02531T0 [Komagataella phaffii GS115]CAY67503.1 Protein required for accurate chromosome segregation [Komagataella phaffii GS115]CCA36602.1 Kinetochore-microtubule binding complex [Komagataella phaffii CBS 7435]
MGPPSDEENARVENKKPIPYRRHSLASTTSVRSILKQVSSNVIHDDTKDENKTITVMQQSFLDGTTNALSTLRMGSFSKMKPRPSRRVTFAPEVTLHKIDLIPQYIQPEKGPRRRESFQGFSAAQILRDGPFPDEDELREDDDEAIGREMLNDSSEDEASAAESENLVGDLQDQGITGTQEDELRESESLSPIVPEEFDSLFDEAPDQAFSMELTQIQLPKPYQRLSNDLEGKQVSSSEFLGGDLEKSSVEVVSQANDNQVPKQLPQTILDIQESQTDDILPVEVGDNTSQADCQINLEDNVPMELTTTVSQVDQSIDIEDEVPMELTQTVSQTERQFDIQNEVPMELTQTASQAEHYFHAEDGVPMELTQTVSQTQQLTHKEQDMEESSMKLNPDFVSRDDEHSKTDAEIDGENAKELGQTQSAYQLQIQEESRMTQLQLEGQSHTHIFSQPDQRPQCELQSTTQDSFRTGTEFDNGEVQTKETITLELADNELQTDPGTLRAEPNIAVELSNHNFQAETEPQHSKEQLPTGNIQTLPGLQSAQDVPGILSSASPQICKDVQDDDCPVLTENEQIKTQFENDTMPEDEIIPMEVTQYISQESTDLKLQRGELAADVETAQQDQALQSKDGQMLMVPTQVAPQTVAEGQICMENLNSISQPIEETESGENLQPMEITEQVFTSILSAPVELAHGLLPEENEPLNDSIRQASIEGDTVPREISEKSFTEHSKNAPLRQKDADFNHISDQPLELRADQERSSRPSSKTKKGSRIKPVCVQELEDEDQEFAASTETPRPSSSRDSCTAPVMSHSPKKAPSSSSKIRTTSNGSPVSEKKGHKRRKLNNDSPLMDQRLPIIEKITLVEPQTSTALAINSSNCKRTPSPTVDNYPKRRASLSGPLTPQKESPLSLQEKILSLTPRNRKHKKRFSLDISRLEKQVQAKDSPQHLQDPFKLGSPMQFKCQTATSIVPLAETSFLDDSEQALLNSQDDYINVSLSEFLSSINVTFYDDLDVDCVPYKNGKTFDTKPSLQDFLYAFNRLNFLQLLEFSCKELSSNIDEGKIIFSNLEAEILDDNPPLIREYMELQHNSQLKKEMQRDFHLVKNYSRQQARGIWYNWRLQLLKGIEESVTKKVQTSREANLQLKKQLEQLTMEYDEQYKNRFVVLKDKLTHLRRCKQLSEAVDKTELENFRKLFDEVHNEIEVKQQEIKSLQSQLDSLNKDIALLNENVLKANKVLENKKDIKEQQLDKSMDRLKKICDGLDIRFIELDQKSWELKFEMYQAINVSYSLHQNRSVAVSWLLGKKSLLAPSLVESYLTGLKFLSLSEKCRRIVNIDKVLTKLDLRFLIRRGKDDILTMTSIELIENCKVSFEINVRKWIMKENFLKISTRYYENEERAQNKEDAELLEKFNQQTFQIC